jgi:hypothetical protein
MRVPLSALCPIAKRCVDEGRNLRSLSLKSSLAHSEPASRVGYAGDDVRLVLRLEVFMDLQIIRNSIAAEIKRDVPPLAGEGPTRGQESIALPRADIELVIIRSCRLAVSEATRASRWRSATIALIQQTICKCVHRPSQTLETQRRTRTARSILMHLQLCSLEQTSLKVFRYGRLIRDKTLVTWGGKTRIGRVALTAAAEACG